MRGRPAKPITEAELEKLCGMHCTDEEIAAWFEVSTKTIERRKKSKGFLELYERGRAKGRVSLRRLQWETAKGDGRGAVAMQIWLGKQLLGQKDQIANEHSGPGGSPIEIVDVRAKLADLLARRANARDPREDPQQLQQ